ncbi:HpcH/HpaI aldolase/citrate lyase family protein [Natrarchaeobius chitinivorans]|uniref:HpcH/HpaI aldolase/citrate lyase domain-containing protein n=1 Tax=Natrarchaeobius chitinivorans TaxID=1679083 RepID=A0A3N6PE34_NATCH|nr:aldolase/citrate lyase family protein [Natrarchaeobius chitinivorans]RQG95455.1 hypothetical protein EA473_08305 [Natrarchaeobius chitinivorans]
MSRSLRRSLQYAPADNHEKIQFAADSNADGVILDLEHLVPASNKDSARSNLTDVINDTVPESKETVVRINGIDSEFWLADTGAAIDAGADTIRLPKVEQPWEIKTVVETATQLTDSIPEFLVQLETPRGVANGVDIARECGNYSAVTGISLGIGDYTNSIGVEDHTRELRAHLLNRIAEFAAIGDMEALGYVHKDLENLRESAEMARDLGHVGQPVSCKVDSGEFIGVLNDVYSGPDQ